MTPPMQLITSTPRPWTLDDKINLYECMVDVWQFGPTLALLTQIESQHGSSGWAHAGYCLLSLAFTYFESIGKTLNPGSAVSGTAGWDFNVGFCDVYPTFTPANGIYKDKINSAPNPDIQRVVQFRDRIRNGMYHLGYTKSGVFIHNQPLPPDDFSERPATDLATGQNTTHYYVKPHALARTVVAHFPGFLARVRDTANADLRLRFEAFFDQFISS